MTDTPHPGMNVVKTCTHGTFSGTNHEEKMYDTNNNRMDISKERG